MKIALVDTTGEAAITLARIADAVEFQIANHYARMWQSAGVILAVYSDIAHVPSNDGEGGTWSIMAILKDSDEAGALGYHATTPDGRPYARIFTGPILGNGGTWIEGSNSVSQCVSHEALEMVGDPYANWWADAEEGYERAIELCDYVEEDTYEIEKVAVSNFLGPRAFSAGPGPYDYMGILSNMTDKPRPGNYEIRRSISGTAYPVYGERYPEWKKALKSHPASRTARRLRLHDEYMVIGDEVPDQAAIDLKRMSRYAKGLAATSFPPVAGGSYNLEDDASEPPPKSKQPLFTGKLTDLVRR